MKIKDLWIDGKFQFRFIFDEETNEWVCRMPTWLMQLAEESFSDDL